MAEHQELILSGRRQESNKVGDGQKQRLLQKTGNVNYKECLIVETTWTSELTEINNLFIASF